MGLPAIGGELAASGLAAMGDAFSAYTVASTLEQSPELMRQAKAKDWAGFRETATQIMLGLAMAAAVSKGGRGPKRGARETTPTNTRVAGEKAAVPSIEPATGVEPADMPPYKKGGGHHTPMQALFIDVPEYDPYEAPAISNAELERLKINHREVSVVQRRLYGKFKAENGGRVPTMDEAANIEIQALVECGTDPAIAKASVQKGIDGISDMGVSGPIHLPWGK